MSTHWNLANVLALIGILVAVVFGLLEYFKDGPPAPPASAGVSTTTTPRDPEPATTEREEPVGTRSATHTFPAGCAGETIWIRVGGAGAEGQVTVRLSWGAKHREETVDLDGDPVYLTSMKTGADLTPINVALDQPQEVGFGCGDPPDGDVVVAVDRGWTS